MELERIIAGCGCEVGLYDPITGFITADGIPDRTFGAFLRCVRHGHYYKFDGMRVVKRGRKDRKRGHRKIPSGHPLG